MATRAIFDDGDDGHGDDDVGDVDGEEGDGEDDGDDGDGGDGDYDVRRCDDGVRWSSSPSATSPPPSQSPLPPSSSPGLLIDVHAMLYGAPCALEGLPFWKFRKAYRAFSVRRPPTISHGVRMMSVQLCLWCGDGVAMAWQRQGTGVAMSPSFFNTIAISCMHGHGVVCVSNCKSSISVSRPYVWVRLRDKSCAA